ncbi:cobalt ECF transporter T component CbiQ [Massilia sp. IC2-278]|uniref:cobalt ECF transporter T component CbiQ n=1 Tax=Massilia sp. IC2-278 TaxID=2887200 RepID=UPI001E5BE3DD|nr:cobalt ECF transporter T component CbiQ [Massilia sp. IC2-278]MCC2960271.1 cobalt ECF transporter T component CbiQ [Massilia sp. IC2-278]
MLIETAAYASRWRQVAPSAKALFALAGVGAAWLAHSPAVLALLAALLALAALFGARIALRSFLGLVAAPLGFLLLSCLAMLAGPDAQGNWGWHGAPLELVARTALRSLAVLAALLGFVLTTPLPDLISLLRRLRTPELLLDLMVLCYRMLFVLRQAWNDGVSAQRARLGYGGWRHAWRSMGLLAGQLAVQVWQRSAALQMAADARGYAGTLRFLPAVFPQARRQNLHAALAGALLLALAAGDRLW